MVFYSLSLTIPPVSHQYGVNFLNKHEEGDGKTHLFL